MKTELLKGLEGFPGVHQVDTVTPRTFLSGQIQEPTRQTGNQPTRKASLLHRIGEKGIIVCLDFSTVLSMKADDKKIVLADLRRIYDGHLRKEFGTSEEPPEWKGRITFLVAATPEVDRHYSIFQTLRSPITKSALSRTSGKLAPRPWLVSSKRRLKTLL